MKSTNKENFKAQLCQYHQYRLNMKTEKKRKDLINDLFLEYLLKIINISLITYKKNYNIQYSFTHITPKVSCKKT